VLGILERECRKVVPSENTDKGESPVRILVIENSREEQMKAVAAIEAAGHEAVVTSSVSGALKRMKEVDAVITDLMFPPERGSREALEHYRKYEPPMGLCMVIAAMAASKPVAVCTGGHYHHGVEISFIYDGFINPYEDANEVEVELGCSRPSALPFAWEESKNWGQTVKALERKMEK
jgi:CheY-like chemotaxis protein